MADDVTPEVQPERPPVQTAYQHRPLSKILAPAAEPALETKSGDTPPVVPVEKPVEDTLPEKYQGKTVAQVAEMHLNAEKELGRVRNEVGTYRGLVSDLSALQRTAPASEPAEQELEVSGDDLINDPVGTVRRIVKRDFDAQQVQAEESAATRQVEIEGAALLQSYPDLNATVASPEFRDFAIRTPTRQADFQTASTGEGVSQVRAARRLLEDFNDFQTQLSSTPSEPAATPLEVAKQVTTEGGGPSGPISTKPQIYEADVIELINTNVEKYRSPSYQTDLIAAIKEGRFVKLG